MQKIIFYICLVISSGAQAMEQVSPLSDKDYIKLTIDFIPKSLKYEENSWDCKTEHWFYNMGCQNPDSSAQNMNNDPNWRVRFEPKSKDEKEEYCRMRKKSLPSYFCYPNGMLAFNTQDYDKIVLFSGKMDKHLDLLLSQEKAFVTTNMKSESGKEIEKLYTVIFPALLDNRLYFVHPYTKCDTYLGNISRSRQQLILNAVAVRNGETPLNEAEISGKLCISDRDVIKALYALVERSNRDCNELVIRNAGFRKGYAELCKCYAASETIPRSADRSVFLQAQGLRMEFDYPFMPDIDPRSQEVQNWVKNFHEQIARSRSNLLDTLVGHLKTERSLAYIDMIVQTILGIEHGPLVFSPDDTSIRMFNIYDEIVRTNSMEPLRIRRKELLDQVVKI